MVFVFLLRLPVFLSAGLSFLFAFFQILPRVLFVSSICLQFDPRAFYALPFVLSVSFLFFFSLSPALFRQPRCKVRD
jgi:hypothetical protein